MKMIDHNHFICHLILGTFTEYPNLNRSTNFMASCCGIVPQLTNGMVHFFRMLQYAR